MLVEKIQCTLFVKYLKSCMTGSKHHVCINWYCLLTLIKIISWRVVTFGHSTIGCFKHLREIVLILFLNYSTCAEKYSKDINVQNGSLVTSETLCNHYTTQAKKENIIT